MQTCDMLENHDFGRKLIKHLVAIVISVRVAIGWRRVALVALVRVGCIQGRREAITGA